MFNYDAYIPQVTDKKKILKHVPQLKITHMYHHLLLLIIVTVSELFCVFLEMNDGCYKYSILNTTNQTYVNEKEFHISKYLNLKTAL